MRTSERARLLLEHADRIIVATEEAECAIAAVKGTVGATDAVAALPSTAAGSVAPALTGFASYHPQLTDQARLRELTLSTVDVVRRQRYHHLPDATRRHRGAAHSRAAGSPHTPPAGPGQCRAGRGCRPSDVGSSPRGGGRGPGRRGPGDRDPASIHRTARTAADCIRTDGLRCGCTHEARIA